MTDPQPPTLTLADIRAAAARIAPYAHRTPVMTCSGLDRMTAATLFFKCENLQKVGAFKFRGACNAVFSLAEGDASRGVATHSSGNHAAALALAAALRRIEATVVMPEDANRAKRAAAAAYGARIVSCAPTLASREQTLAGIVQATGATVVHPYNDVRVMAGQGTAACELLADVPDLDALIAPVGGGGLLGGTATAAAGLAPDLRVLGAEPAAADDAYRSLAAGHIVPIEAPVTIADGLRTSLGSLTFPVIRRRVHGILRVSEAGIVTAMRLLFERMKLVVEPSGAVPLGALLEAGETLRGLRVGIILSGGNVDLDALPW